jgi:hypothetical protein
MNNEFPKDEIFLDFEGKERIFDYRAIDIGDGYSVAATERTEDGYCFQTIAETSPFRALGELRSKIRKRLSTRYLQRDDGNLCLSHDEAKGHISSGGVVIDGKHVSFDELASIMQVYEGFLFELKIKDLSEE